MARTNKTKAELQAELDALRAEIARLKAQESSPDSTYTVYEAVVENSNQGLLVVDRERVLFANRALADMTGHSREELSALTPEELITRVVHPDDRLEMLERFRRRLGGPRGFSPVEFRVVGEDGETRWLELFGVSIDFQGRPALQMTFMDVTQRVRAEQHLRETTERLDRILDTATDVIITMNSEQNITLFNKAAERAFGYIAEQVIGKPHTMLLPERFRERHHQHVERFAEEERAAREMQQRGVLYGLRADGTEFPIDAVISKVSVGGEQLFTVILRDITERKRVEEQLRQHNTYLEALHETSLALLGRLEMSDVLQGIIERAASLVGSEYGFLDFVTPLGDAIEVRLGTGKYRDFIGRRFKRGEGLAGKVWQSGEPIIVDDLASWAGRSPNYPAVTHAAIAAPLKSGDRVIGVIGVGQLEPGKPFTPEDLEVLNRFAPLASIAYQNARLLEAEREQRLLAEALRNTSEALNSTLNFNEVLDRILSVLARVVPHDASDVLLIDPATDVVSVARARGFGDFNPEHVDAIVGEPLKVSETANLRRMRETGLPMTIPDVHAYEGWRFVPGTHWTRSYVGAPIRIDGQVIGFLSMFSAKLGYFADRHAGHLQAFADQAALAIKNARLYQRAQSHADQLEVLHLVTLNIAAELDLDALLHTLTSSAVELLNAGGGGIYLCRPERQTLEWVVSVGSGREPLIGTEIGYGEGLSGKVWASGQPMVVDNYSDWEGAVGDFRSHGWSAVAAVPLRWGDEFLGVINADADPPRTFSEEDVRLLGLFADQAAIAIKNARLYEQVQRHAAQLETLHRVSLSITAELDLDALLRAIVSNAIEMLGAPGGGIHLYRPERDVLEWLLGIGDGLAPPGITLKRGEGLSGRVWAEGKPLKVDRYHEWEGRASVMEDFRGDALLGVPILWGDEFLGSITAIDDAPRTFSEEDERLLSLFADQAAVAIKNARLYEQVQRHAAELEALRRVTLDITVELDLDALLNALAVSVFELLGVNSGGVYLYRPEQEALEWVVSVGPHIAPPGAVLKRGEGLAGKVWETGQPLIVAHYSEWEGRARIYDDYHWDGTVGVPIFWGDEFLGVICANAHAPREFSQSDEDILSLFAAQAAIAIKNARLYEAIRSHAEDLEVRVAERTAKLNAANEDLMRLGRVKDEFVSNVSHELRTPIASFKLYHELLEAAPREKHPGYLEALRRETARLERIVEDLLHLSILDQDRVPFEPGPLDLNALARQFVSDRFLLAESHGISLGLELHPDLPPVRADEGLLGQALSILLNNALNYTQRGGHVVVQTILSGDRATDCPIGLSVRDDGPGVEADEIEHLFERFFRGKVGRRSGLPGTGLGLSIARQIAQQHGGRVEVESEGIEGKGATFTLWLPLER